MEDAVLNEDIIHKIALCIPPTEPVHLIRAAGVCRIWREEIGGAGFRRAYRRRYPRPPLLGFFNETSQFVPLNPACPSWSPMLGNATGMVLDCRHGRVLLHRNEHTADDKLLWSLVVWDPVTGGHHTIPLPSFSYQIFTGAVICDVPKCKHSHCHGPFVVVLVACDEDDDGVNTDWVTVYSSSTREWSRPLCLEVDDDFGSHPLVEMKPPLLIHGSLYFTLDEDERVGVLRFSLENDEFSLIHPPPPVANEDEDYDAALMVTSLDGGFGYATVDENRLLIWSWKDDGNDPPEWSLSKAINMDLIIPSIPPSLTGSIEGTSSLFLGSADRLFIFDFNTLEIKEVGKKYNQVTSFIRYITPMSDVQESDTEESDIDNAPPDQAYLVPGLPCLSWGDKKGTADKLEVGTLTSSGADLAAVSEGGTDFLEEKTTKPKKPEVVGEKRASEDRIPSGKKAKVEPSSQKTGDKGVHVSTPHPTEQVSKTPADQCDKTPATDNKSNEKSPKPGTHACKSCSKTFGSQSTLESHIKEKHQA